MSQNDMIISDQSGTSFLADLNAVILAIISQSSGDTEPGTTYAYQWWADTTTGILKMRNAGNTGWVSLYNMASGGWLGNSASATTAAACTGNSATADKSLKSGIPQLVKSVDYTFVIGDENIHIKHPTSDDNTRTFTIPSNASVAYPLGTTLTFVNQINTLAIAITTDTLTFAGLGTTGSRTLNSSGLATAIKVEATKWVISGSGLT